MAVLFCLRNEGSITQAVNNVIIYLQHVMFNLRIWQ